VFSCEVFQPNGSLTSPHPLAIASIVWLVFTLNVGNYRLVGPPSNNDGSASDYYRAQAAFCIIAIALMVFTNGMAIYSFAHHRYMFKRLVASLYFIIGQCG
jgi:hypothetical protein